MAFSFDLESAGSNSPARIAIIAITTNNSIKVNAALERWQSPWMDLKRRLDACRWDPIDWVASLFMGHAVTGPI